MTESEARQILTDLEDAHLLEKYRDDKNDVPSTESADPAEHRWRILDPQVAAARLASRESAMRQTVVRLSETRRRLDDLAALHSALRGSGPPRHSVELFGDRASAGAVLAEALLGCHDETVSCRPGGTHPADPLRSDPDEELHLLARGIRLRVLHAHAARHQPAARAHLERLTAAGAEVRTMAEPFGALTVVDRTVGFLPHPAVADGAVRVREEATVAFLHRVFEQAWERAEPFEGPGDGPVRDELHRTILSLLSEGVRDETIARRLGMSLRTCRRHIADIFKDLGAESRFQAGYLTGRRGGPVSERPPRAH
ncbi:helix-turn-helix transcriptional regulator [Streptomyces antibioticus]|uniref:helix-turn-helix transcriptional regulator n=1 Tax=Streptomyces antibioticus TaxID=1890 RepID=UPI0022560141|nr:helix-turn-helix transcriptional regulator [Streptomyces antibioticus]MCX4741260.1 helix-turn-helix transcriptional regulator [Streptomyces antibioticus]